MGIWLGDRFHRNGRTYTFDDQRWLIKCEEPQCEYFSPAGMSEDHAKEILLNHYKVVHPEQHADAVWDLLGVKLRDTPVEQMLRDKKLGDHFRPRKRTSKSTLAKKRATRKVVATGKITPAKKAAAVKKAARKK